MARLRQLVVSVYGTRCYHCRQPIDLRLPFTHPEGLSIEHVRPRSKGGTDDITNLRPAHLRENTSRQDRPMPGRRPRAADWLTDDGLALTASPPPVFSSA